MTDLTFRHKSSRHVDKKNITQRSLSHDSLLIKKEKRKIRHTVTSPNSNSNHELSRKSEHLVFSGISNAIVGF